MSIRIGRARPRAPQIGVATAAGFVAICGFAADAPDVDVGDDGTIDFRFERSTFGAIHVQGGAGDDEIRIDGTQGAFSDDVITLDGGPGDDTWQVKSMGDSVMIWVPDPTRAVALAADTLQDVGTRDDLLPVRVGVHTGPAVMCGWDWYGSTVNVAARLASEARPNEALVSATSRTAASSDLSRPLRGRRELYLRGLDHPVVAWCLR